MSARTVTLDGFVLFDADYAAAGSEQPFRWVRGKPEEYGREYMNAAVAQLPITFTLPDGFHPTAAMVASLEAKREFLRAEFSRSIADINEQISKLQAITFEPAEGSR